MEAISSSLLRLLTVASLTLLVTACSSKVSSPQKATEKKGKLEWTEQSIKKYLDENKDKLDPLEGIYSIGFDNSGKSDKLILGLLSGPKKSNDVARVAILKNKESLTVQFDEFLLEGLNLPKYTKTADFTRIQKSLTYLSRQFSPDGTFNNYSFAYDDAAGSMEGYKRNDTTSKLSYIKLYPVK